VSGRVFRVEICRSVSEESGVELAMVGGVVVHVCLALILSNARRSFSCLDAARESILRPRGEAGVPSGVAGKMFGLLCSRKMGVGAESVVVVVARRRGMQMS